MFVSLPHNIAAHMLYYIYEKNRYVVGLNLFLKQWCLRENLNVSNYRYLWAYVLFYEFNLASCSQHPFLIQVAIFIFQD